MRFASYERVQLDDCWPFVSTVPFVLFKVNKIIRTITNANRRIITVTMAKTSLGLEHQVPVVDFSLPNFPGKNATVESLIGKPSLPFSDGEVDFVSCDVIWNDCEKNISIKIYKKTNNNNNKPWEDLLIMAYTGRLHRKGVSFSGLRYKKG